MAHVQKHDPRFSRGESRAIVGVTYVVALGAGAAALAWLPDWAEVWRVLAADAIATAVVFAFSVAFGNSSLYDPYWSVIPPLVVLYLIQAETVDLAAGETRAGLLLTATFFWGTRLTFNWWRSWQGLHTEDWRYLSFRPATGRFYWPFSFLSFHLFPTLTVFVGMLPIFMALLNWPEARYHDVWWVDYAAFGVCLAATLVEAVADEQMWLFRQTPARSDGAFFEGGLWRYSRHPNYFGEVMFWFGISLFAIAANPNAYWWGIAGFAAMVALFLGYSIPAMDKKMAAKRPGYRAYMRRTSPLIPLPRRAGPEAESHS
jgi:steroid 5-alpha reductase family enzyme